MPLIQQPLDLPIPGRLPGFGPGFMAHGPASKADLLGPLTSQAGVGAVITSGDSSAAARGIRTVLRRNPRASVLADAGRYSGRQRAIGAEGMSAHWINMQLKAGCEWALTDSGYIPTGDRGALRQVLTWPAGEEHVIAALPLALSWLTDQADVLSGEIAAAGMPVALMLEHESDPLSTDAAVAGLIDVLATDLPPVLLLRSDTSTLGALAHGAEVVSVGTTSRYRHIFPIPDDDTDAFTPPPSMFVEALMSYKRLNLIADLYTRDPDNAMWRCGCVICAGRSIEWILTAVDRDDAAFEHSVAALARTASRLLADSAPAARWQTMCARAQLAYDEIPVAPGRPRRYPPALRAWVRSTPQTAAL